MAVPPSCPSRPATALLMTSLPCLASVQMHGVLSEVLGPKPDTWLVDARTPPTVFVAMDKDPTM